MFLTARTQKKTSDYLLRSKKNGPLRAVFLPAINCPLRPYMHTRFLRATATRPNRPEPNSQTAAGTGMREL